MSNQSSVEWFFDQLVANQIIIVNKTTYGDKVKAKHQILLEQAKAMHKEESQKIFECGRNFQLTGDGTFEEVYNETFNTLEN